MKIDKAQRTDLANVDRVDAQTCHTTLLCDYSIMHQHSFLNVIKALQSINGAVVSSQHQGARHNLNLVKIFIRAAKHSLLKILI